MPLSISLSQDDHVILYTFTDPWTVAEIRTLFSQEKVYRDQHPFTIHTLIDVSQIRTLPPGMLTMRQEAPSLKHERSGQIVIVGALQPGRALMETIFRVTRYQRVRFVENLAEGWDYLRSVIAQETKPETPPISGQDAPDATR